MTPENHNCTPIIQVHSDASDPVHSNLYEPKTKRYSVQKNSIIRIFRGATKFFITERLLGLITRLIDVGMIYIIATTSEYAALKCFLIMTPLNIAMSILVIYTIDKLNEFGFDVTGIEEMRKIESVVYESNNYFKRFIQWMLRRKSTIFLIGSWFYLDPDYVTLFVRNRNKSFWWNISRITVPSVVYAMIIWTFFYWALFQGYHWVRFFTG